MLVTERSPRSRKTSEIDQLLLNKRHQLADGLPVERKACAGGLEQLRQGTGVAQSQGGSIVGDGFGVSVLQRIAPNLQRA